MSTSRIDSESVPNNTACEVWDMSHGELVQNSVKLRKRRKLIDWDSIYEPFKRVYIDEGKSLPETMQILKKQYDFKPSVRSFKNQMKEWGITKYRSRSQKIRSLRKASPRSRMLVPGHASTSGDITARSPLWEPGRPMPTEYLNKGSTDIAMTPTNNGEIPVDLARANSPTPILPSQHLDTTSLQPCVLKDLDGADTLLNGLARLTERCSRNLRAWKFSTDELPNGYCTKLRTPYDALKSMYGAIMETILSLYLAEHNQSPRLQDIQTEVDSVGCGQRKFQALQLLLTLGVRAAMSTKEQPVSPANTVSSVLRAWNSIWDDSRLPPFGIDQSHSKANLLLVEDVVEKYCTFNEDAEVRDASNAYFISALREACDNIQTPRYTHFRLLLKLSHALSSSGYRSLAVSRLKEAFNKIFLVWVNDASPQSVATSFHLRNFPFSPKTILRDLLEFHELNDIIWRLWETFGFLEPMVEYFLGSGKTAKYHTILSDMLKCGIEVTEADEYVRPFLRSLVAWIEECVKLDTIRPCVSINFILADSCYFLENWHDAQQHLQAAYKMLPSESLPTIWHDQHFQHSLRLREIEEQRPLSYPDLARRLHGIVADLENLSYS